MKTFIISTLLLLVLHITGTAQPEVVKKTPALFSVPESVCIDTLHHYIYVSNIQGNPLTRDGEGFISRLNPDGSIQNLHWITHLDAPKGMAILNNKLFVSNIDEIVEIDILTATITTRYTIPGAQFLNDVAAGSTGEIYCSDTQTGYIHKLHHGETTIWKKGPLYNGVNGLRIFNHYLLAGTAKGVIKIDLDTGNEDLWLPIEGGVDGLIYSGNNNFLISDWHGHIYQLKQDTAPQLIINMATDGINAADIDYDNSQQLLYVPTFHDNRIFIWHINQ